MSGREISVIDTFYFELLQACARHGTIDLKVSLNGADRKFNADTMFSSDGQFFLIEFKSSPGTLKKEEHKPSACILCEGLFKYPEVLDLHQQCHFAMWGRKEYKGGLDTVYGIYEDLVCRTGTLPLCEGVWPYQTHRNPNPTLDIPLTWKGIHLADEVSQRKAGLDRDRFLKYLEWLLWARNSGAGSTANRALPIILYGTSLLGGVKSIPFKNFLELEAWAKPYLDMHNKQQLNAHPSSEPAPSATPTDEFDSDVDPEPKPQKPKGGFGPRP